MDGGAWWAAVHGAAKSRTRLSDFTFPFTGSCIRHEKCHSSPDKGTCFPPEIMTQYIYDLSTWTNPCECVSDPLLLGPPLVAENRGPSRGQTSRCARAKPPETAPDKQVTSWAKYFLEAQTKNSVVCFQLVNRIRSFLLLQFAYTPKKRKNLSLSL